MYDTIAPVYEWLVPDELAEPEGAVAGFAPVVARLAPGARVLDCAAGTGELAVGLALRGFDVAATDASEAMVERTRALAVRHAATLRTATCTWDELGNRDWGAPFDAVFCVGNSFAHAAGPPGRRVALAAMADVLRDGGLLVLTSRNWELLRAARPGLEVPERLVERRGRRGLPLRSWSWAEDWDEPARLDVAVALLGESGAVVTARELLVFWPFEHGTLERELHAAGFERVDSTWAPGAELYMVTACRAAGGGAGAARPRPPA